MIESVERLFLSKLESFVAPKKEDSPPKEEESGLNIMAYAFEQALKEKDNRPQKKG